MAEASKIQWTDATWNPWHGCTKVSPGCKYCYMFRDKERYNADPTQVIRSKTKFNEPLIWSGKNKAKVATLPPGSKIFTCSWSDFFIEDADQWREEAWQIIKATPQFTYQILTKRPERIKQCLPEDWGEGYPNVWLGVSAEYQNQWDDRVYELLRIPAAIRFVSAEPLLGPIDGLVELTGKDMARVAHPNKIDWVIIGGESGNENGKYKYRECDQRWIVHLLVQCMEAKVPAFVKQTGTHISKEFGLKDRHGGKIEEWPKYFKVRRFPEK